MATIDEIRSERGLAADLLETLTPQQLQTQSLCGKWTVQQVAGHQLMTLVTPLPKFAFAMIKARGNFDVANDSLSRSVGARPATEIAQGLRTRAGSSFHAPGFPLESALADLLIHGQDIRRPLGLTRDFDPVALRKVLDFLVSAKAQGSFVPKGRLSGVRLQVDDLDWSTGSGATISGTAEAVMMMMSGRDHALQDLTGDGTALIRERSKR